jgi:3-dehydro-L-gulonate 2-dehydrogenase
MKTRSTIITMLRIPYSELLGTFERATLALGLTPARAQLCARLFAETTRDGVNSHGINRFPRYAAGFTNGSIDVHAEPKLVSAFGALERWDGQIGPGNLNAHTCILRTIELARKHGLGCVALANTNHWMRGGTYGWMAAEQGLFALCWSNTLPNMPAWGASQPVLGNNPLVIAIPRPPAHVVLDMAVSQFSYGQLANYARRAEPLPIDGGYDSAGNLTRDAAAIEASQRPLPIGYWKGSGLALVLDMIGAMLSGGLGTYQITHEPALESKITQVFLAIDPSNIGHTADLTHIADGILADLHAAPRADAAKPIRYPGEQVLQLREENMRLGVPVDPVLWAKLQTFAAKGTTD